MLAGTGWYRYHSGFYITAIKVVKDKTNTILGMTAAEFSAISEYPEAKQTRAVLEHSAFI
jgi:hypothetical protein